MGRDGGPTLFLASVTSVDEARLCAAHGADLIDCKNPARGALGALPVGTVAAVRAGLPASIPVSATVGDLAGEPETLCSAVADMAASGADIIKIGFFPGGEPHRSIAALGGLALGRARLVGVLLADLAPDMELIEDMADAGFMGVMLDTAGKTGASLPDLMTALELRAFLADAHAARLTAGLAGALRVEHIPGLVALHPDVLGFRGALCRAGDRRHAIDAAAVARVRRAIPAPPPSVGAAPGSSRLETCPP
jgi:uncharacterized protein (UPF0264 family)